MKTSWRVQVWVKATNEPWSSVASYPGSFMKEGASKSGNEATSFIGFKKEDEFYLAWGSKFPQNLYYRVSLL